VIRFDWESLNFQMALSSDDVPMHVENSEKAICSSSRFHTPIASGRCAPEDQYPSLTNNSAASICRRVQARR
jgi:hypothetical protein